VGNIPKKVKQVVALTELQYLIMRKSLLFLLLTELSGKYSQEGEAGRRTNGTPVPYYA